MDMDPKTIFAGALVLSALAGCNHTMPRTETAARSHGAGFELPIVALSAAGRHICAVGFADPVQCMYVDGDRTAVVDVPGTEGAIDVAVSAEHACALFGGGRVTCFGWSGTATTGARLVAGITDAFEIAVGGELVCARSERGTVRCSRSPPTPITRALVARAVTSRAGRRRFSSRTRSPGSTTRPPSPAGRAVSSRRTATVSSTGSRRGAVPNSCSRRSWPRCPA
jgi:hypothetical protein